MKPSDSGRLARFGMLALFVAVAGIGCAGTPTLESQAVAAATDFRDAVSASVEDAGRREVAEATAVEMAEQIDHAFRELGAIQSDVFALNANYDTTREEFDAQFRRASLLRRSVGERLIELALELRTHTTGDEWKRIQADMAQYGSPEGK